MPSTTAGYKLPYPLGTDRLMDGDDQIRKLAQSVENMVQVGRLTIPITAANTVAAATFTFPVPFLNASIFVVACGIGNAVLTNTCLVSVQSIAAANTTIAGLRQTGTATFDVFVMAVGPVAAVA